MIDRDWRPVIEGVYRHVVDAVDPRQLVRSAVQYENDTLVVDCQALKVRPNGRIFVLAIGKAANLMMAGAVDSLGQSLHAGLAVAKSSDGADLISHSNVSTITGDHPVPGNQSEAAGQAVLEFVDQVGSDDLAIMLISGGGSALVESPVEGITLEDISSVTDLLLRAGADITELNAVRRSLSRIKGGRIAERIAPARIVNLIISDVLGNPLTVIASGPTVAPDSGTEQPIDVIERFGLSSEISPAVRDSLTTPSTTEPFGARNICYTRVLADAETAARSAADYVASIGYQPVILGVDYQGEASGFARWFSSTARWMQRSGSLGRHVCLIGAGELTVTVRGDGVGGRNTEMAVAAALEIDKSNGIAIASLATDGDDGISGAAGGYVTGATVSTCDRAGIDARALIINNDTRAVLESAGSLLLPGMSGTNVNDIYLAFIERE